MSPYLLSRASFLRICCQSHSAIHSKDWLSKIPHLEWPLVAQHPLCVSKLCRTAIFWFVSEKVWWSISLFKFTATSEICSWSAPQFISCLPPVPVFLVIPWVSTSHTLASVQSYPPDASNTFLQGFGEGWAVANFADTSPRFQRTASFALSQS